MVDILKYPGKGIDDSDDTYTLIQFVEYARDNPNSNPTERATSTVIMPLPAQIPDTNTLNIESANLGAFGMALPDFERAGESLNDGTDIVGKAKKIFGAATANLGEDIIKGLAQAPGIRDSALGARFQQEQGVIKNPHTTSLFNGVALKTHELSWRVSPRSQDDADTLNNIIATIKERAYPSTRLGTFSLNYPDEVYIKYVNLNVPSVRKSFVTGFNVNYGGGNGIAIFKDGTPVEIEISLNLMEVEIITREELLGINTSTDDPNAVINSEEVGP